MTEEKIRISKEIANELVETILSQIRNGFVTENTLMMLTEHKIRGILDKYVVVDKSKLKNKLEVTKPYSMGQIPYIVRYSTGLLLEQKFQLEVVERFGEDFIKNEMKEMFVSSLEYLED